MGFTAWDYLDLINSKKVILKENTDFIGVLKHVINKNTDALVFDNSLPYTKSAYYFSSIKYPEIIEEFNKFLLEEKDFVLKLKIKYKVEDTVKRYPPYKK